MGRVSNAQKAGLDLLDQVAFNELVCFGAMTSREQRQLRTIIGRVTHLAESRYEGRQAELIKHLAYIFLGLMLTNTLDECRQAFPVNVPRPDMPQEQIDAAKEHIRTLQMATMLACVQSTSGFDASFALEIAESLRARFVGYSAVVRQDLAMRCFVAEFREASVKSYCWLIANRVLPVTKNSPDRINTDFDARFLVRIALICDLEMIRHFLMVQARQASPASAVLGHPELELSEATIGSLLYVQKTFNEASTLPSLRNRVPMISGQCPAEPSRVQQFFENWAKHKARLRMHPGTLGSWLGILGAVMVETQLAEERKKAQREEHARVAAIFNAVTNENTITALVKNRLSGYGLQINADTLYRKHAMLGKTLLRLVQAYCQNMRDVGVVYSAINDDPFYVAWFMHADKLTDVHGT